MHKQTIGGLSHICVYKPIIIQTPVATFSRDFKGLVPVDDPCLVAGENILDVSRDWWFYFQEQRWLVRTFGLHQKCVSSGVKIDGSTSKPFSIVQAIRSGKARLFFQRDVPSDWLNVDGFEKERLTWRFCSATKAYQVLIKVSSKALAKISRTTHS